MSTLGRYIPQIQGIFTMKIDRNKPVFMGVDLASSTVNESFISRFNRGGITAHRIHSTGAIEPIKFMHKEFPKHWSDEQDLAQLTAIQVMEKQQAQERLYDRIASYGFGSWYDTQEEKRYAMQQLNLFKKFMSANVYRFQTALFNSSCVVQFLSVTDYAITYLMRIALLGKEFKFYKTSATSMQIQNSLSNVILNKAKEWDLHTRLINYQFYYMVNYMDIDSPDFKYELSAYKHHYANRLSDLTRARLKLLGY